MTARDYWKRNPMKQSTNDSFNKLIGVHTRALEENSKSLVEILELLSEKELNKKNLSQLKEIKKEIKSIDKKLDMLGKEDMGGNYYGI